jgi:alanine racemase
MLPPRPTIFEIDLDAAAHNARVARQMVGPERTIYAVIKADGYGHGAVEMGETFLANGAEALGVADLGEGIRLRRRGITAPSSSIRTRCPKPRRRRSRTS